jgi:hypothetical protein
MLDKKDVSFRIESINANKDYIIIGGDNNLSIF